MTNTNLTGDSTIGAWLAHPSGAPALVNVVERTGMRAESLRLLRDVPLNRLLAGQEATVAQLVDAAGGDVALPPHPGSMPSWQERIASGRFAGKTVVVTGAASGIGRAVASRVAREGGRVVAVDLDQERLKTAAAADASSEMVLVAADLTTADGIDRIVAATAGRVDALANVAGLADDFSAIHEVEDAMLRRVFDVNVFGLIRLTRAVIPMMMDARRGSIVNVASEAAMRGSSSGIAYTASKHAVVGVTRSTAFMYEPYGIRVNAVAPGGTLTGMRPPVSDSYGAMRVLTHTADVPIALPEALAASIAYFLSEDSVNVTGALLPSDGGESVF